MRDAPDGTVPARRLPRRAIGLALAAGIVLVGAVTLMRWLSSWQGAPDQQVVYKRVGGHALALHLFRPAQFDQGVSSPALLLFHGGGWQMGDASQFHPQCRHFSKLGLTCLSVSYRTASSHRSTPADAVQDARDAIRFVRRHAEAMGILPNRIIAGGGSAGGHLAAALGTALTLPDPGRDDAISTRPDALVLYNPMIDLSPGMPDHERVGDHWLALSPRHHVDGKVPPTLILSGSADPEVAVATVEDFCRAVREQGGLCTSVIYPGAGHGFFNPGVDQARYFALTNQALEAFLVQLGWLAPARS